MKNWFVLPLASSSKLVGIVTLFLLSGFSSQQTLAKDSVYSELLNNCAKEIYNHGFDSDNVVLKLKKKVEKAGNYRFWINIENTVSNTSSKAYCTGKKKGGVITKFEILT
ncbi:MAG: hypothetical protein K6L75_11865 [Cellvibrionaceae bacterium]